MKSVWARTICRLLVALMIWTPYTLAHAGMVGTDQVTTPSSEEMDRAAALRDRAAALRDRNAVLSFVTRADVAGELEALGLDQASAKDRVAAMTDSEASYLAGQIERLPAGGDTAGVILLILIIAAIWWVWKR